MLLPRIPGLAAGYRNGYRDRGGRDWASPMTAKRPIDIMGLLLIRAPPSPFDLANKIVFSNS
jgi:hypothetical protein